MWFLTSIIPMNLIFEATISLKNAVQAEKWIVD